MVRITDRKFRRNFKNIFILTFSISNTEIQNREIAHKLPKLRKMHYWFWFFMNISFPVQFQENVLLTIFLAFKI